MKVTPTVIKLGAETYRLDEMVLLLQNAVIRHVAEPALAVAKRQRLLDAAYHLTEAYKAVSESDGLDDY